MEISRTTDYAVRAVLDLAARAREGDRVTAGDIARRQGIPRTYVPKVLQALARAGIVAGSAGRSGGVRLCRPPSRLSVLDIVRAMEGPVALNRCLLRPGECPRDRGCTVHRLWRRAEAGLARTLGAVSIAALLGAPPRRPAPAKRKPTRAAVRRARRR